MLSRRRFLAASTCLPLAAEKKVPPERPNILLVLWRDVGAWMTGCYGNREIRTPQLDRLAQAGARFAHAFTGAPTPGAGRAELLGGADALTRAGYHATTVTTPEEACRVLGQLTAPFFLTVEMAPVADPPARFRELYAAAKLDSVNYEPAAATAARGREMFGDTLGNLRRAAAAVSHLDDQLAPVLDCLRRRSLADSTIVVATSTNGVLLGRHGLWGDATASNPPNLYDEVVAVPLIWSRPARIPPASVRPELVSAAAFVPTLCELAGVATPAAARSYLTLTESRPLPKKQPWVNLVMARAGEVRMVRDNRYKLIQRPDGGQLFDIAEDPRERVNQFDNPRFVTVRDRLAAALAGKG